MPPRSEFCDYVMELLAASGLDLDDLGHIRARRMFGGYGIFFDELMFALIARDTLFIKVDDDTRASFQGQGMAPFIYARKGGDAALSYYEAPPDALESPDALEPWAAMGLAAARRAAGAKRRKPSRRPRTKKAPAK